MAVSAYPFIIIKYELIRTVKKRSCRYGILKGGSHREVENFNSTVEYQIGAGGEQCLGPGMSGQDADGIGSHLSTELDVQRVIPDHDRLFRRSTQNAECSDE